MNSTKPPADSPDQGPSSSVSLTKQQKHFNTTAQGSLKRYKELVVGEDRSWAEFTAWELYTLLLSGCPSLIGYGLRRIALKSFLDQCGSGLTLGRGVVIRQPRAISLGQGIIIEDYASLDVRSVDSQGSIVLGDHVFLGRHSIIAAKGGSIRLGDGCNISSHCRIATQTGVTIGPGVLVAAYAYIGPGNHKTERLDIPIMEQEMELRGGVEIGEHAWIGTHATILDGVKIGRGAIVGAHSLVNTDIPDFAIAAGCPARVIKMRTAGNR